MNIKKCIMILVVCIVIICLFIAGCLPQKEKGTVIQSKTDEVSQFSDIQKNIHTLETPNISVCAESFSAEKVFLYDLTDNSILFLKGELNDRIYPASITKLFTAYVALKYLSPTEIITVGDELELIPSGSSIAYILKGQKLKVETLIEGMLLPSGNDASYILAVAAGKRILGTESCTHGQAVAAFVEQMNNVAKSEGMNGTNFVTVDGFHHENHYTTIYDTIKISKLALSQKIIAKYVSLFQDKVYYESGENATWVNTNRLLNPHCDYYIEDAIGLKTGYTAESGYCLLSAYIVNGKIYISGVFGCSSETERFEESITLYNALKD